MIFRPRQNDDDDDPDSYINNLLWAFHSCAVIAAKARQFKADIKEEMAQLKSLMLNSDDK